MKQALLIVNTQSGSASAVDLEVVSAALRSAGFAVEDTVKIPEQDCPDGAAIEKLGADVVVLLSGDGTVASLCDKLGDWPGSVLVLPGGTMNLMARRLHGDVTLQEIIGRLPNAEMVAENVPVICVGGREVMTGLIVGATTRWGHVREGIRHGDVATLAQTVPEAWAETMSADGVWIEGQPRDAYSGIFVEPREAGNLSVIGFRANNIGDMLGHGVAWLRRDFRNGPSDDLGTTDTVTIVGDDAETGLLIDGEYEDGRLPVSCKAGMSSVKFLRIVKR